MEYLENYGINNEKEFIDFLQSSKRRIKIVSEILDIKDFCMNSIESIINYLNFELKETKKKEIFDFDYLCIIQKIFYEEMLELKEKYDIILDFFLKCQEILKINNQNHIFETTFELEKFSRTYEIILLDYIDDFLYFEKQINIVNSLVYFLKTK